MLGGAATRVGRPAPVSPRSASGNIRYLVSGSAALSKDVDNWFDIVGLTILEGYGLTETSAGEALVRPNFIGRIVPGTEIRIADDGEIMVRGPGVIAEPPQEANAEVFGTNTGDEQFRWFATADIGVIDDKGRVKITDPEEGPGQDLGGKYIAPGAIEALKAKCPLAGAVGGRRERPQLPPSSHCDPDAAKLWAGPGAGRHDMATAGRSPM